MNHRDVRHWKTPELLLAPSILAADFAELGAAVRECEAAGAELLHLDIMDGHFVPNLSLGPNVVRAIRPYSNCCFDVHLMLENPVAFAGPFVKAGADHITMHVELEEPRPKLQRIRELGCSVGLCLKPATPARVLTPYLDLVDMILVMTVEPGFGGQAFEPDMLPKISEVRELIRNSGRAIQLEVDGGIDPETAPACVAAGANVLVVGSSIFRAPGGIAAAIGQLRSAAAP